MKNIIYILTLVSLLFSSCDDVLDRAPLDIISDNFVWDDPTLVDAYILDVYSRMIFMYNDQSQSPSGRNYSYLINVVNDQATNGRSWSQVVSKYQAGLITETGGWENWHYENIRRTNEFFDKIETSTMPEDQKQIFIGRVKLARALIYFTMVKWYGGIPLITEAQDINSPIEELQVPRSTEQAVYDFIISECDEIINQALLLEEAERLGDPSVYVAHALKSRAALYAASIARWGTVQNNGLVGISKNQEQKYWQVCYDASQAIMNGPFTLYSEESNLAENYRKLFIDESNSEVIWAKYYDGVEVANDWSVDNGLLGWAAGWLTENICPYLEFIEEFEDTDGTISPWDREAVANQLWTYDELFGSKEPRFHAMIYTNGSSWSGFNPVDYYNGIRTTEGTIKRSGATYNGISVRGQNYRTSGRDFSGFGIKKGVDPTGNIDTGTGKNQKIQFRLGEILLNYAEAAFYLDKKPDALTAMNQVRARVNLPAHTDIDEEKIRHERKIELAFEAHRHWDLKRWRIAKDAISKTWTGVNYVFDYETGKFLVEYKENFRTTSFEEKHYYFPITPNRISNNPALAPENPGY